MLCTPLFLQYMPWGQPFSLIWCFDQLLTWLSSARSKFWQSFKWFLRLNLAAHIWRCMILAVLGQWIKSALLTGRKFPLSIDMTSSCQYCLWRNVFYFRLHHFHFRLLGVLGQQLVAVYISNIELKNLSSSLGGLNRMVCCWAKAWNVHWVSSSKKTQSGMGFMSLQGSFVTMHHGREEETKWGPMFWKVFPIVTQ